jgi:hypothetical protein
MTEKDNEIYGGYGTAADLSVSSLNIGASDASGAKDPLRREFIKQGAAAILAVTSNLAFAGGRATRQSDLWELTAVSAVGAMRRGDVSAEAYVMAVLARCDTYKTLNAFISLEPDRVLESARRADLERRSGKALGLLHGLPLPVKDGPHSSTAPDRA